jgi:PKD repeat protein
MKTSGYSGLKVLKRIRLMIPLLALFFAMPSQSLAQCSANAAFNASFTGCATVQFTDLSSAAMNYTIVSWDWDFGDGNTSTVQNPLHVYDPGSTYIVTLTVTADSSGVNCTDVATNVVTVPGLPSVYFTWDPDPTCHGTATSFFGTSGNPIVLWSWDFGDGQFSNIQNPIHLYPLPGFYDVTLTVTDVNGCTNNVQHQVTVAAIPDVDFTFSPDPTCLNGTTSFSGSSSAAVTSWLWNFGDGGVAYTQNPIHTYLTPGIFTATLTVTDTSGCLNSISHDVTVNALPTANFLHNAPVCLEDSVEFINISTTPNGYITQWIWDFGDGTNTTINFPDDPNVSHSYSNTGTFQVTLTVTDSDGCTNSTFRNVIIVANPIADFTYTPACNEEPVYFFDLSSTNGGNSLVSWYWDFGDPASGINNTSTLQNPSHVFTTGGSFSVLLIVTNTDGCTDSISKPVSVNPLPEVTITTDSDTICVNTLANFYGSGSPNIVTWLWSFGDGGTSVLQNPQHIYTTPGTYTVTLTGTDSNGCDSTDSRIITVTPLPFSNFSTSAPACEGSPVDFYDLSSAPNGWVTEWHWYFGDGSDTVVLFPDPPDVSHTYNAPGSYLASLVITSNAGCTDSSTREVVVSVAPQAEFSAGGPRCDGNLIQFFDESLGFGTNIQAWSWNFGDPASGPNNFSSLQNPYHLFSSSGTYTVWLEVMNNNGCFDSISHDIEIYPPPPVYFTVSPDGGVCRNEPAYFTVDPDSTNIATVMTYLWDFGDPASGANNISTLPNPSHQFTTFGTFDVTLTISDTAGCINSITLPVNVLQIPTPGFSFLPGCFNDSTRFFDESLPGAAVISNWHWKFNDPAYAPGDTSDLQNPAFMFSSIDEYFVQLTVTDNNGCSATLGQWIEVFDVPNVAFTFDQSCNPPGFVQFTSLASAGSSGSPLQSWYWELDDGYFSSEINPSYNYGQIDTCYVISLTVTDVNQCSNTLTDTICLFGQLSVDFTADTVCFREQTLFRASFQPASDSVTAWNWNFGDGTPVFATPHDTVLHLYDEPGEYLVTLNATDENGCSASVQHIIRVDSLPAPDFTASVAFCDSPTVFQDLSSGNGTFIQSWDWNFGDVTSANNTSTLQNPSHFYDADDSTYYVSLRVSNYYGCYDSIVKPVYKGPCVTAMIEAIDPPFCSTYPVCFSLSAEFFGSGGGIYEWQVNYGDGNIETYANNPGTVCHVFDDPGNYPVSLVVLANVGGIQYSDTAFLSLDVSPSPTADFLTFVTCSNQTTLFENRAEGNGANVIAWEWDFGDPDNPNDTSSLINPSYQYPYAGLFDVQMIVTSNNGCTDTLISEIEIFEPPLADFSNTTACEEQTTGFFDESVPSGPDIYLWNWDFGDPANPFDTAIIRNPAYTYQATGSYEVTLIIEDLNQCRDTVTRIIDVFDVPVSGFNIIDNYENTQGQVLLENISSGAEYYYWDFGNGDNSEEFSPVVQYLNDGTYVIELVAFNEHGCPDTTIQEYKILFKGLFIPSAFVPKGEEPVKHWMPQGINIKRYKIEVYTLWGNLVWSSTRLTSNGRPLEFWNGWLQNDKNEELLPAGNYIWKASAVFVDGSVWQGMDDGDGNFSTSGVITLIR